MFGFLKNLRPGDEKIGVTRSDMLRHTEFFQFNPMTAAQPKTVHAIHTALREFIEDSGAATTDDVGPVSDDKWSSVIEAGDKSVFADYMTFSGYIKGNVKLDKPEWLRWTLIVSGLLLFAGGVGLIGLIVFGVYWYYLDRFGRGDIYALYTGTYQKSTEDRWGSDFDVMVSYHALREVGGDLVKPIFEAVKTGFESALANGYSGERSLPKLYSNKASDFNKRFPVRVN